MRGVPWRSIGLAVIAGILMLVAFLPDPTTQQISSLSNEALVEALTTDRVPVRRAIVGQLVARSKTVVPTLESSAPNLDELQLRGVLEALEELMLSPDPESAEEAEACLERLSHHQHERLADRAMHVLYANSTLRHARAMSRYLEAGGKFARDTSRGWPRSLADAFTYESGGLAPRILLLDENWVGGDAELKQVARLFPGDTLLVHVADSAPVSTEALEELQQWRNNLLIRRENEACLGIVVNIRDDMGVEISDVTRNSPAERAGLKSGDVIVRFEREPVVSLKDLRRLSSFRRPGEGVVLMIRRQNHDMRMKLQLGNDFGTGNCLCHGEESTKPIPESEQISVIPSQP